MLTILLEPRRISELRPMISRLKQFESAAKLKEAGVAEAVDRALAAQDLWSVVGILLKKGQPSAPWPAKLAGWDDSQPLVLGLHVLPVADLGELALWLIDPRRDFSHRSYEHDRLIVPAREPAELLATLQKALRLLGLKPFAAGGRGAWSDGDELRVWLVAGPRHVRLELGVGSVGGAPGAESAVFTSLKLPPGGAEHLDITSALRFAANGSEVVRGYVRLGLVRDFVLTTSAGYTGVKVSRVSTDKKLATALAGFYELAYYESLFSGSGEAMDFAFGLASQDAGWRLTTVSSLTAQGQSLYATGTHKAYRIKASPSGSGSAPLGSLALNVDLDAMLQQAEKPAELEPANSRHFVDPFGEGLLRLVISGPFLALRSPVGFAQMLSEQHFFPRELVPRGGHALFLEGKQGGVQGAIYAVLSSSSVLDTVLTELTQQKTLRGRIAHGETRLGGGLLGVRLGLNADANTVYGANALARPSAAAGLGAVTEPLIDLDVDLTRLEAALGSLPESARQLGLAGRWRLVVQLARSGKALFVQWVVALPKGSAAAAVPELRLPVETASLDPAGPQAVDTSGTGAHLRATTTPGTACLRSFVFNMGTVLGNLESDAPDRRLLQLQKLQADTQMAQACAVQDPQTRGTAERLRQVLWLVLQLSTSARHAPAAP